MIVSDKLINFSEKNREENLEKIRQILLEGAIQQMQLESINNSYSSNEENTSDKEKLEFFDI
jgi:hypothetical protein